MSRRPADLLNPRTKAQRAKASAITFTFGRDVLMACGLNFEGNILRLFQREATLSAVRGGLREDRVSRVDVRFVPEMSGDGRPAIWVSCHNVAQNDKAKAVMRLLGFEPLHFQTYRLSAELESQGYFIGEDQ